MKNVRDIVSSRVRTKVKSQIWSIIGSQARDLVDAKIGSSVRGQIFGSLFIDVQENIDCGYTKK